MRGRALQVGMILIPRLTANGSGDTPRRRGGRQAVWSEHARLEAARSRREKRASRHAAALPSIVLLLKAHLRHPVEGCGALWDAKRRGCRS